MSNSPSVSAVFKNIDAERSSPFSESSSDSTDTYSLLDAPPGETLGWSAQPTSFAGVGSGATQITQAQTAGSLPSETVTSAGSGVVFHNTYGSGVTAALRSDIIAAENYMQAHYTNVVSLNLNFDVQNLGAMYSGQNTFSPITVSYSALVNALASHATNAADLAEVASLRALSDPSGNGFEVSVGMARVLGLAPAGSGTDDSVVVNSYYWSDANFTNNAGDAQSLILHEITEGAFGRIGNLGVGNGLFAPMDLFRYNSSGQRDFTGGSDGLASYFSVNGQNIVTGTNSYQFHNSLASGSFDGQDFADWNQVGANINATDPFGPGGPGVGDTGSLSTIDQQIMNALGWTTRPTVLARSDFDGSGTSDILLQNSSGSIVDWLVVGGRIVSGNNLGSNPGWSIAGTGDFDNNGNSDILLVNSSGNVVDWSMGNGTVHSGTLIGNTAGYSVVGTGDFNGDGTSDILLRNSSGSFVDWIVQNGAITSGNALGTVPGWTVAGTGDFNHDGSTDILLVNSAGTVVDWQMHNGIVQNGTVIGNTSGYSIVGTGDFNGDGTADILLENSAGNFVDWIVQNGVVTAGNALGANPGWSVASIGDYNGDGTSDILLTNSSGAVVDWQMHGGTVQNGALIGNSVGFTINKA